MLRAAICYADMLCSTGGRANRRVIGHCCRRRPVPRPPVLPPLLLPPATAGSRQNYVIVAPIHCAPRPPAAMTRAVCLIHQALVRRSMRVRAQLLPQFLHGIPPHEIVHLVRDVLISGDVRLVMRVEKPKPAGKQQQQPGSERLVL